MSGDNTLFKDHLNADLVKTLAHKIQAVHTDFDATGFVETTTPALDALELKARSEWIADQLRAHLPDDYPAAVAVLRQILMWDEAEAARFNGFALMPIAHFVEKYGHDHYDASMQANYAITQHFTAEFSVRPFIEAHPTRTLALLREWAHDDSEHVRRLVSEGTRPRLPWAAQLKGFIADPTPLLPLLDALKDDPSQYVRRSVANNLNDIAKDHPQLVIDTLRAWSVDASKDRQWVIKHALRTLIKQGDPDALAILGYSPPQIDLRDFDLTPSAIHMGETVTLTFTLVSQADTPQSLMIDYVVHFVKANGETRPKVFKLTQRELPPGESVTISRAHTIKPITTRKYYAGTHTVQVQVNGVTYGSADFDLML